MKLGVDVICFVLSELNRLKQCLAAVQELKLEAFRRDNESR